MPPLVWPSVGLQRFVDLLLPAAAFALIAFADTVATVGRSRTDTDMRWTPTAS